MALSSIQTLPAHNYRIVA